MARKKKKQQPEGGGSDWLLTFSDLLTLLITLFVLLISMSSMDSKKLKEAFSFFNGAVGALNPGKGSASNKVRAAGNTHKSTSVVSASRLKKDDLVSELLEKRLRALLGISDRLVDKLRTLRSREEGAKGLHALDGAIIASLEKARPVTITRRGDRIDVGLRTDLVFVLQRPDLRADSADLISAVAALRSAQLAVHRVRVPVAERGANTRLFSPWDLALWRAGQLARRLRAGRNVIASVATTTKPLYASVVFTPSES